VIAEEHPLRDLRQELRLHRLCDEILLEPFSESEVAAYMQERVPDAQFPEAFVRRLHEHTDGLPLFVANVAETLLAQTDTLRSWLQAGASAPLPVPDSLAGVIEKQIGRLNADTQLLLQAAAVCGVEFRVSTVTQILNRDSDWVSTQCDELVRRQFWLRHVDIEETPDGSIDPRYAFSHALYRHVFYQRLSASKRVEFHRRAAKAIDQVAAPVELASHHERGHQPLLAMRYYAEAAANAVTRHFAPEEAINLTSAGLRLIDRVPDGPQRMELELALVHQRGIACAQVNGIASPESISAFDRARALCDALPETPERALLLNGLGLTRYVCGDYSGAIEIADRAHERAGRFNHPLLRLYYGMLRGLVHLMQAEYPAARERLKGGIDAYREMDEARIPLAAFVVHPLVTLQSYLAIVMMHVGLADQARALIREARANAEAIRQPMTRMLSYWNEALIAVRTEDVETIAFNAERLRVITEETLLQQFAGPAKWLQGWAEARVGSPRMGFQTIREGFEIHAQLGRYSGNTETLSFGAEALLLAGDLAEARTQLDEAEALAARIGERFELPNLQLTRARVVLAEGDRQGAEALMQVALRTAREQQARYYELKALVALCSLENPSVRDLTELRDLFGSLQEGLDLPLARRAATLIRN
jgi:tetratricopeptide (TPR) repeat protein